MTQLENIHKNILKNLGELNEWHSEVRRPLPIPAYTSIDIRDSGQKISSVDANIYPAGFNNICDVDRESAAGPVKMYLSSIYPEKTKVVLITEEHTNNAYYWQNVYSLRKMIEEAGYEIQIAFPRNMETITVESSGGHRLEVHGSWGDSNMNLKLSSGFCPEIILSNNDFSQSLQEWSDSFEQKTNPPRELGWYQRKKSDHFLHYNEVAGQFSEILKLPKQHFQIQTELFPDFDMSSDTSKQSLAKAVDEMLLNLKDNYRKLGIDYEPSVFVKNNAGTYGLAVNKVNSGEEILAWNNRARTKMRAAKAGAQVNEVILQEGIPSRIKSDGSVAEPVIYLFGCQLIGGFLRTHSKKGESESLNSPGAVYKRLCMSDLLVDNLKHPEENVYGWIGKLSSLAVGKEISNSVVDIPVPNC